MKRADERILGEVMFPSTHITSAVLEAFLDNELPGDERHTVESHLESCVECEQLVTQSEQERRLFNEALFGCVQKATDSIDWISFEERLLLQLTPHVPAAVEAPRPQVMLPAEPPLSFGQWLFGWLKAHPALVVASVATCGLFLLFALPYLDPGPSSSDKDVIVDKVTKSKTAKVSVLQRKVKETDRPITVIVVREPMDPDSDDGPGTRRTPPKAPGPASDRGPK